MRTLVFFIISLVVCSLVCVLGSCQYLSSKEGVEKDYVMEVKAEIETAEGKTLSFNLLTCRLKDKKAISMVFISDTELTEGYLDLYVDVSDLRGRNLTLICDWNKEDMEKNDIKNVTEWDLWHGKMNVANATRNDLKKFEIPINTTGLKTAYLMLKWRNTTDRLEVETRGKKRITLHISNNIVGIQYLNDSKKYNALREVLDSYWRWGLCGKDPWMGNLTKMLPGALVGDKLRGDIKALRSKTRVLINKVLEGETKYEESAESYSDMLLNSFRLGWFVNALIVAVVISFFHWLYRRYLM